MGEGGGGVGSEEIEVTSFTSAFCVRNLSSCFPIDKIKWNRGVVASLNSNNLL